ncbi:MAG: PAS domain S-box protein [Halobacteriota archaeon]|nr:PAS domain S-box protein [Halobacteriota archaeon]
MNVLIAEDDDISRVLLEGILKIEGFTVITSCDGAEAWEKYKDNNISIALLDWMMPRMDGVELCQHIRDAESSDDRYTYILMVTAKNTAEDIVEAMTIGADDYIKKPFDKYELLARVQAGRRILESKQKLKESEEKYRTLIENSMDLIMVFDLDGDILLINDAGANILGEKPDYFIGKSIFGIYPEKAAIFEDRMDQIITSGVGNDFEDVITLPSGERWFWVSLHPVKEKNGNIFAIQAISHDMTERKQVEKRELKIKDTAIQTSINPIIMADVEGKLTYANTSFLEKWRYNSVDEVIGLPIAEFFKTERDVEVLLAALSEKGSWLGELTAKRKGGLDLDVQLSASMVKDDEGSPIRMMFSFIDITLRKQAWEAVIKSEERYKALTEDSADGIFATNKDGLFTYINPVLEDMCGIKSAYTLGTHFGKHFSTEASKQLEWIFCDLKDGKNIKTLEFNVIREDGSSIPIEINAAPVIKDGEFDGMECSLRDITNRKKLENDLKESYERLQVAYEELKELDQMKTDFVSVVTHELRTPLAIIRNNLEMFLDGTFGDLNELQEESMGMIFNNIERLIKLVQNSLDMSRIYGDRLKLKFEQVKIKEIFEKVVSGMKLIAEDKEHKLTLEVLGDIPVIECDEDRITQVLTNLLHNAIKFTPNGGKIGVTLQRDEEEGVILAKVSDNGIGIPEDEQENIFKQFYEVDSYLHHESGTGLGLSIVKGIVESHGGKIWVESTPEVGSTFSFTIPEVKNE